MIEYLPLGSIVLLEGGVQKVFIVGRALLVRKGEETFFFDYAGVPYPEGVVGDQVAYFNAETITKVVFKGYSDVDDENAVGNINRYLQEHPDVKRGDPASWQA